MLNSEQGLSKVKPDSITNILTLRYDPNIKPNLPKKTWNHFKPSIQEPSIEFIEKSVKETIRKQLDTSDVKKVCVALSGGIDSTLILTLIKKTMPDIQIDAISVKFANSVDETENASKIAAELEVDHHIVYVENYMRELPKAINIVKLPFWDLHWYHVAKKSQSISKHLASGDGGDELFGGYTFRYKKFLSLITNSSTPLQKAKAYLSCHERDRVPDQEKLFGKKSGFSWENIYKTLITYFDNPLSPLEQVFLADYNGKLLYNFNPINTKILNHFDFSNIIVVSGYHADDLAKKLTTVNSKIPVQMVVNPDYEEGSIISLSVAMDMLKENSEIILMDADVLYDSHIIKKLIGSDYANCLLLDRNLSENDVEAVKICVTGDKIVDFHKKITKEYDFCGESVGFFRFDSMMAGRLASRVKEYIKDGKRDIWYEEAIRDLILNYERKKEKINETKFDVVGKFDELKKISNSQNKISSYLTIQEGCDKFCHFCVVPYTRGPEYSRPFEQIIDEAQNLVSNGAREIILLGQNVNAYNYNKKYRLSSLIKALSDIKNLKRIRFTTSHPKDMTEDLIDCYKDCEKLMPLLHLPIQSGSNKILKLMNRKHNKKYYLDTIEKIKNVNNDIKFSSDFIIGYPGELEKDYKDTIDIVEKVGFINSYSFIFSPRPGTPAFKLNDIDKATKKARLSALQSLLKNQQKKYNKSFEGKKLEVLFDRKGRYTNQYIGRSIYNQSVFVTSNENLIGKISNVTIIRSTDFALEASI